ncbi:hypothetical protein BT63DRAFT_427984 [Microthyrium microscopicum]|uniref:Uncharacterized protein n=1 Tax=Microthyrium microscopicum TaxID=703497 RepID=A0A6A6U1M9_9PEZI|nr:hypothetical protein BT63DRAFT_427984 [Microthyrium microscopicum]
MTRYINTSAFAHLHGLKSNVFNLPPPLQTKSINLNLSKSLTDLPSTTTHTNPPISLS